MQVYKFLPANCALDDLLKRRLKISTFGDMNDPFELYGVKFSEPQVQSAIASHSMTNHGVLCFCRDWSNPMLWSHYADKHKGICLGFEIDASVEIYEPVYVENRQVLDCSPLVDSAVCAAERAESDPGFQASQDIITKMLLTKFKAWEYEDEVRIFIRLEEDRRDGGLYFAEFDERIKVNMVIAGPRCSVAMGEVKAAVSGCASPVKLTRAILSPDSFEVIESR